MDIPGCLLEVEQFGMQQFLPGIVMQSNRHISSYQVTTIFFRFVYISARRYNIPNIVPQEVVWVRAKLGT